MNNFSYETNQSSALANSRGVAAGTVTATAGPVILLAQLSLACQSRQEAIAKWWEILGNLMEQSLGQEI